QLRIAAEQVVHWRPSGHLPADDQKLLTKIEIMLGKKVPVAAIEPGEAWADAALQDLQSMNAAESSVWGEILDHARTANGSSPSKKWLQEATRLIAACGAEAFGHRIRRWLPLLKEPRTQAKTRRNDWEPDPTWMFSSNNAQILKGLMWM